jgi:hypothetical protein
VDAAVFPFAPTEYHLLDVEWIHYPNMFATPEVIASEGIGFGDEIAVIGLFTGFSGEKKHFPFARIENLAMLPNERIPLEGFDPMEAYLAEGRSIGGLSGSPVFVRQTVNTTLTNHKGKPVPFAGVGQIYFLGLIHGHWDLPRSFEKTPDTEAVNMGISNLARSGVQIFAHAARGRLKVNARLLLSGPGTTQSCKRLFPKEIDLPVGLEGNLSALLHPL